MHVGVEAVGTHAGGGWAVLDRTVERLVEDDRVERLTIYCSPRQTWASEGSRSSRVHYRERPDEHASLPRRVAWHAVGLGRAAEADGVDVLLCLNGMGRSQIPHVNVVQQAMMFAERQLQKPAGFAVKLAAIRKATQVSCREASAVVVQTSWMRAEVLRAFGDLDVRVLPLGLPGAVGEFEEAERGGLLLVTSGLPYKNGAVVREGFGALRAAMPAQTLTVVGVDWDEAGVTSHERLPPREAMSLYRRAAVTVVPSLVESMGLPLVEAMTSGAAIVAADRPYAREVCDNAALYFEPDSPADFARVAGEVLRDSVLRRSLVERGRRRLEALRAEQPEARLLDLLSEAA